jgi:hypothetical protein
MENPFALVPYVSKEYFCDREEETKTIVEYLVNGSNITLISPRRYGKTGLIYRIFDEIEQQKVDVNTCYVDIYATETLEDFIKVFSEAVIASLEKKKAVKSFFQFLGGLRPMLSYDPLSGNPELTLIFRSDYEKKQTLASILQFIEKQDKKVVVAIDEFQQIRYYGINMEALLRSYIQPLQNVQFIFCGSKKHLMTEMFTDARNPFYESTRCLYLEKIDRDIYAEFIVRMFEKGKKAVTQEALDFILDWTKLHTFYTQSLCNHLFIKNTKTIGKEEAFRSASQILKENEQTFIQWRNLLTSNQWNYLKAVAKEQSVEKPYSTRFIQKYNIGTSANSQRLLEALIDKELILVNSTLEGVSYSVYNVFLSRWLESQ